MTEEPQRDVRKVFVIHGRNESARAAFFDFLRAIGLRPIEWAEAIHATGQGSPYVGDVLDVAFGDAQAVIVLQTPDDVAYLHESLTDPEDPECQPQMQPRPNVLFEAGMAFGRYPNRTILVELGRVKAFSDIHGRHVIRLDNSPKRRTELARRLETAGCKVSLMGTDWYGSGDLTPPVSPGGGLPMGRKLPLPQRSGVPRLSGTLDRRGGSSLSQVIITNHGPGEVFDLSVEVLASEGLVTRPATNLPIPRLPAGKSVKVLRTASLEDNHRAYFNITITAATADGTTIRQEEFVS